MEINKKVRSKKLSTRVDLTAMVSVSFLLIIFFMVATELRKSKIIELTNDSGCDDCMHHMHCYDGANRNLTIILGENNKLIYYVGLLASPIKEPQKVSYGKNGIRKELLARKKTVLEYSAKLDKPSQGITVIIKPTKKSNYGNLVDILDEMKITGITSYAIVPEFTPEESKLLASN